MDNKCKVLVVDDEDEFRVLLCKQLARMGYSAVPAANGALALSLLGAESYDVSLIDLSMPVMDGLTLLSKIQADNMDTIPVILSSRNSVASAVDAMKRGAFDYIDKDASLDTLRATISRAFAHRNLQKHASKMTEAAQALKKSNMEMERLVDSMSSFLVEVDAGLIVRRWNSAAERTFGLPATEVLGRPFVESGIGWDWALCAPKLASWLCTDAPIRLTDLPYTKPDGTKGLLGGTINPIRNDQQEAVGFFFMGSDITERKALEVRLLHAQKLESIGQLAAGIAHEINTPTQYVGDNIEFLQGAFEELQKLHGAYQTLLDWVKKEGPEGGVFSRELAIVEDVDMEFLSAQIPRALTQSLDGIGRIASIVRAMKEFSHPGSEKKECADLNHLIESTITVSRNEWKYVADVKTEFDLCLPTVPCLAGEFNQVILNILVNAAHALGEVLEQGSPQKGLITVSTRQQDGWAEIRISDTGPGIPHEIRNRIFDPFFTTKEVGRGTGQGLAIARHVIVDKHGGTLDFDTKTGEGTTFIIRLPLREAKKNG